MDFPDPTNEKELAAEIEDLLSQATEALKKEPWPEYEKAIKLLDLISCKRTTPDDALQYLSKGLEMEQTVSKIVEGKDRATREAWNQGATKAYMCVLHTRSKYNAGRNIAVQSRLPHAYQTENLFELSLKRLDVLEEATEGKL